WLLRQPRFQVHYTPTYSSWLNQVERWFAALTEKQIRRGTHRSTRELEDAIRLYLKVHNQKAKPFVWVKTADQDLVGGLDPHERLGVLVVNRDEQPEGILQLAGAAVGSSPDLFFGQDREPAFDLVDPRAIRRRVVEFEARMAEQPASNQRSLVG